jgi:hypothetical protein
MTFNLPLSLLLESLAKYTDADAPQAVHEDLFGWDNAPLVSISGGQDSLFLAWSVFQMQKQRRLQPTWLYHNHLWHAEGFFHGVHCLRLAMLFGWPFVYTLPLHPVFDEERAWDFRHRLRGRLCAFYDTHDVLVGHTKTDRTESLLFHLLRGSLHQDALFPRQRIFSPSRQELFTCSEHTLSWEAPCSSMHQRQTSESATRGNLGDCEASPLPTTAYHYIRRSLVETPIDHGSFSFSSDKATSV